MNAAEFKKLINLHFSPRLKELGWKGSGFNFYRHDPNHVVNLFGMHGSPYGGTIYSEVAIQFDFIPCSHGGNPAKMSFASCMIRERIGRKGLGLGSWQLYEKESDNLGTIEQLWQSFQAYGLAFYDDFSRFPHPFDAIKPSEIEANEHYRLMGKYADIDTIDLAWLLKEINLFIGNLANARDFSELGLRMVRKHVGFVPAHDKSRFAV